jgi:hypothetical protein
MYEKYNDTKQLYPGSTEVVPPPGGFAYGTGTQVTESEGHQWPPEKPGFHGDIGGDFTTTKSYLEGPGAYIRASGNNNIGLTGSRKRTEWYEGTVITSPGSFPTAYRKLFPISAIPSDDDIAEWGATAVSRCKPTNSASNLAVTLGELVREGFPRVAASMGWRDRASVARAAGDDYLNAQFGWRPLINDISDTVDATFTMNSAIEQLRRDSGRLVRRGYEFPVETSSSEVSASSVGTEPFLYSAFRVNNWSAVKISVETETRRWFKGAFTYWLPDSLAGEGVLADIGAAADRFGLTITPENLWNLAPWSWAVDWFTNAGDVISNISDSQRYGLIMPYGYMMVHTIQKCTYSPVNWRYKPDSREIPATTFVTESKVRRKANPFGFGVSDTDLDPFQISILAALGLSRSG